MKKFLSIFALFLASATADAQVYFRAGLGYAVANAGQSIAGNEYPYSGTANNGMLYNINDASFSAGLQGYLSLGGMINKHSGLQLDAQIGLAPQSIKYTSFNFNQKSGSGAYLNNWVSVEQRAKHPINFVPSLVVKTGGDPWDIYCRMGIVLPVYSVIEKQYSFPSVTETWEVRSSFSAGFTAAAGLEYKLSPSVSFWAEVSLVSMSLYIKEAELTTYSIAGQNIPLYQLRGTMNISYEKNVTVDTTNFTNQPSYSQPFSNVGFNVGARLTVRKKHPKRQ